MALPAAVQRQVEEAEALQQQLYPPASVEEPTDPGQPPEAPVDDAPAATEPPATNVVELTRPAEPAKPAPEQPKSREDDPAYWRQRFQTVSGILDVEVPRLNAQVKEQNAKIQQLLQQLEDRQAPEVTKDGKLVTSKDAEDFGEDLVDMVRRCATEVVRAEMDRAIAHLREELRTQLDAVAGRVEKTESDKFWDVVKGQVPDWDVVDNDPSWFEFLNSTPEFASETYREIAAKAIAKGDAVKIVNLVKLWRPPAPAPVPVAPKPDLQRQVAPSTSRASAPAPATGKVWTRADYEAAMDVRNVARYGAAKAEELAADATRAVAEGRVHW